MRTTDAGARRPWLAVGASVLALAAVVGLVGCTQTAHPVVTDTPAPGIRDSNPARTAAELFAGGLYVDPQNHSARAAKALTATENPAATTITKISSQPTAIWLGDQISVAQMTPLLDGYVAAARAESKTLVFVTYAITDRDCGDLSAGGLAPAAYLRWSAAIADALRGSHSVVLVEPDSLAMLTESKCAGQVATRPGLIHRSVDQLVKAGLTVYLDAGNSHWVKASTMAALLRRAGVDETRGFFTNVSNFYRVDQERSYGESLASQLGGKHFVVDVSRDGNGWQGTWCNPSGAALGQTPHVSAGTSALDALLWVKHPGDSDGTCNGGPKAGEWWQDYAVALVRNSHSG